MPWHTETAVNDIELERRLTGAPMRAGLGVSVHGLGWYRQHWALRHDVDSALGQVPVEGALALAAGFFLLKLAYRKGADVRDSQT